MSETTWYVRKRISTVTWVCLRSSKKYRPVQNDSTRAKNTSEPVSRRICDTTPKGDECCLVLCNECPYDYIKDQ